MFKLAGIIEDGTTAIGIHTHEGTERLVAICLAKNSKGESLSDKKRKELEGQVRLQMLEPDVDLSAEEHGSLTDNFTRSTEDTLTVPIHSPESVEPLVERIFPLEDFKKMLLVCDDEESYLSMCAHLGMSRTDFMRFGKLKAIIEEGDKHENAVLGSAHKLIEAAKVDKLSFPYLPGSRAEKERLGEVVGNIVDAEKFFVPEFELPTDSRGQVNLVPGDYSLPYPNCFIEYEFFGQKVGSQKKVMARGLIRAWTEANGEYHSELYNVNRQTGEFMHMGFGPKWRVDDDGAVEYLGARVENPKVRRIFGEQVRDMHGGTVSVLENRSVMALKRIGPLLTRYNDPRYRLTHHRPSEKAQKNRVKNQRTPFFEHHVVSPRPLSERAKGEREAREGAGSKMALRAVRRHFKPSQGIWVEAYLQGDPKYGIDVKSFNKLKGFREDPAADVSNLPLIGDELNPSDNI